MTTLSNYDLTYGVHNWMMLGNNAFGDCYIAAFEHLRMSKAMSGRSPLHKALYRAGFRPPHTPYTEEIYWEYGHAQGEAGAQPDQGTSPSAFATFALSHKLALGAGAVNITPSNPNWQSDMRQAMVDFGGGVFTVNLSKGIWSQLYSKHALDYDPAVKPPFIGAHAVTHLGFTPDRDVYVTWGTRKDGTLNWTEYSRIEYWVFVTPEDLLNPNIDAKAMLAKIATLENGAVA